MRMNVPCQRPRFASQRTHCCCGLGQGGDRGDPGQGPHPHVAWLQPSRGSPGLKAGARAAQGGGGWWDSRVAFIRVYKPLVVSKDRFHTPKSLRKGERERGAHANETNPVQAGRDGGSSLRWQQVSRVPEPTVASTNGGTTVPRQHPHTERGTRTTGMGISAEHRLPCVWTPSPACPAYTSAGPGGCGIGRSRVTAGPRGGWVGGSRSLRPSKAAARQHVTGNSQVITRPTTTPADTRLTALC